MCRPQLNSYMRILKQHAVDPELVKQIFRQLFYYMCSGALNNLLLRKDMCNWSKGMQIRSVIHAAHHLLSYLVILFLCC